MSLQNSSPTERTYTKRTRAPKDIDFCKIGGLRSHIQTLRETIIFPLIHGNVFSHFNIKAPRGVLFYGPPGTGKTLVAAALATELNKEGIGKVAFFHRKGADILEKWVGGSEKNLRDLFEKATKSRPAIIFFDELDGLAPARQKQNDHIHASIVATLLALMDGLDNKPGVIVIGATNRIEAIDPALRRPGRFDKELYFPLPGVEARKDILQVHTSSWKHKPSPDLLACLVDSTSGFSGADLQALCSEAILRCMKRIYPCLRGIKIDPELLQIEECDFTCARVCITPSALRQGHNMRKLSPIVRPLLEGELRKIMKSIHTLWPHFLQENYKYVVGEERYAGRILLIGTNAQGLNTHLVPAVLQNLEYLPAFVYDITKLYRKDLDSNTHRTVPSVILLSRVDEWWNFITECEQLSIMSTLEDIHAGLPVLVIATCREDLPSMLHDFFYNNSSISLKIGNPTEEDRKEFFRPLFFDKGIVSLYSVLENSKNRADKSDNTAKRDPTRSRKRKMLTEDDNLKSKKSKRESKGTKKKVKEGKRSHLVRSSSASSLYDVHKQIMQEKCREPATRSESLTCLSSVQNKKCFGPILSDLLKQRNTRTCDTNVTSLRALLRSENSKPENKSVDIGAPSSEYSGDAQMQHIYDLWRHASLVTSRNMAVAQLELLYDVISACISIHWSSFDASVKNLEDILGNVENSYMSRE